MSDNPISQNPYSAPQSQVDDAVDDSAVPEAVRKKIRNATVAGIVSGTITLLATVIAMLTKPESNLAAWTLLDVALVFGLTFGIYRKSRVCAVAMVIYFAISKIVVIPSISNPVSMGIALVVGGAFIYLYVQGMLGAFAYHKHLRTLPGKS
jgi:hypothetical protein